MGNSVTGKSSGRRARLKEAAHRNRRVAAVILAVILSDMVKYCNKKEAGIKIFTTHVKFYSYKVVGRTWRFKRKRGRDDKNGANTRRFAILPEGLL